MPRQRAIRFPDDLHDAIEAEAERLGHPHTFSSCVINATRRALELRMMDDRTSPSPSYERFKGKP